MLLRGCGCVWLLHLGQWHPKIANISVSRAGISWFKFLIPFQGQRAEITLNYAHEPGKTPPQTLLFSKEVLPQKGRQFLWSRWSKPAWSWFFRHEESNLVVNKLHPNGLQGRSFQRQELKSPLVLFLRFFGFDFWKAGNAEAGAARSSIARGLLLVCFAGLFTYLRNIRIAPFDLWQAKEERKIKVKAEPSSLLGCHLRPLTALLPLAPGNPWKRRFSLLQRSDRAGNQTPECPFCCNWALGDVTASLLPLFLSWECSDFSL